MDREELVSVVTREVMRQMKRTSREEVRPSSDREVLVILNHPDRRIGAFLEVVRDLVGTRDRVTLALSQEAEGYSRAVGLDLEGSASHVIAHDQLHLVLHNISIYTSIIVPVLKASFAERLLAVDDSDRFVDIVYQGMLAGAGIVVLTDSILPPRDGRGTVPVAMQARVRNLLSKLKSLNVTITDSRGLAEHIGGGLATPMKRLITEKDILSLPAGTRELRPEHGSIVTPSARDRARERGIRIIGL